MVRRAKVARDARLAQRYAGPMSRRHTYRGACHCGNIEVALNSDHSPSELGVRADNCSFCVKHRAVFTSDPTGELAIAVRDPTAVNRYQFGTRTADFMICRTCGVFVVAMMTAPPAGVVNVNALDARADFLQNELKIASFDGESVEERW